MQCLIERSVTSLSSACPDGHEVGMQEVYSAGRDVNVNSKCDNWFVAVKEFVHESRRDFIASTNSNAVQPQVLWKSVLSVKVKTAVRGVNKTRSFISEFENE